MTGYPFAVALCLAVLVFVLLLLRTRRLREKYAAVWLVLALVVVVLALFPDLAFWLARVAGVVSPVNLLFSGAIVVLLGVCIQLSSEVSALEEETRTVAEEVALLRLEVEHLGGGPVGGRPAGTSDPAGTIAPNGASAPGAPAGTAPLPPAVAADDVLRRDGDRPATPGRDDG